MVNLDYVRATLDQRCEGADPRTVERLISAAHGLLGNLVHYQNGRVHEDEDIVFAAMILWNTREWLHG